jgi:hypothetical protein
MCARRAPRPVAFSRCFRGEPCPQAGFDGGRKLGELGRHAVDEGLRFQFLGEFGESFDPLGGGLDGSERDRQAVGAFGSTPGP